MYTKVIYKKKNGGVHDNSRSCAKLANYLCKEDEERGENLEFFFSHTEDFITVEEVIMKIDANKGQLGKTESKFFTIVIAPETDEMNHIGNDVGLLKEYTRDVMDVYAANFNDKNGVSKNLKGKDLLYFAKVEYNRYYNGDDEEVQIGKAKSGDKKPGNHLHVHIIVSRKDILNKQKLSPLANDKKLFHRKLFKLNSCDLFDKTYQYEGAGKELKEHIVKKRSEYDQVCFQPLFIEAANKVRNKNAEKRVEDISSNNTVDFGLINTINALISEPSEEQIEEMPNKEALAKKKKNRNRL